MFSIIFKTSISNYNINNTATSFISKVFSLRSTSRCWGGARNLRLQPHQNDATKTFYKKVWAPPQLLA